MFINILAIVFTTYLANATSGIDLAAYQGVIHIMIASGLFTIVLFKLPELASGLIGGISSGGFGNVASAITSAGRLSGGRSRGLPKNKLKEGGNMKKA